MAAAAAAGFGFNGGVSRAKARKRRPKTPLYDRDRNYIVLEKRLISILAVVHTIKTVRVRARYISLVPKNYYTVLMRRVSES